MIIYRLNKHVYLGSLLFLFNIWSIQIKLVNLAENSGIGLCFICHEENMEGIRQSLTFFKLSGKFHGFIWNRFPTKGSAVGPGGSFPFWDLLLHVAKRRHEMQTSNKIVVTPRVSMVGWGSQVWGKPSAGPVNPCLFICCGIKARGWN